MVEKVKIGLIGTGNISPAYIKGCQAFEILDLVACADIDIARAQATAEQFAIPKACSVAELLADPQIQMVINLTVPQAHAPVSLMAIRAGKHVYSEKPLAVSLQDGKQILDEAKTRGVLVGCAPDTFLGGGQQTCLRLINDGVIGEPVAAVAFMASHGPEGWHPNPDFFYMVGGGPMFDMGPYYLTALVNLLGPIKRISGSARISFKERIATSQSHMGRHIPVEVPTHTTGTLDFASGAVCILITSFDVWAHHLPIIEIYGSEGSLSVPDPNTFGGTVKLYRTAKREWQDTPLTHSSEVSRGIGVADMAYALIYHRPPRASGELAYHVLEAMHAFELSSQHNRHIELSSAPNKPAPLPMGLTPGHLDG